MRRPVALLSIACVFLVGILAGALATHLLYVRSFPRPGERPRLERPGLPGGPGVGPRFLERLELQLGLTPQQRREIDEILRKSRTESDKIHDEMLPRVRAQLEGTRQRILEALTPEQREEFERLRKEHRGRAERFFLGGEMRPHRRGPGRRGPRGPLPPPGPPPPGDEPPRAPPPTE